MKRSDKGSFTIPELSELLHISNTTAFEISKDPELNRKLISGKYRIPKQSFWEWYDRQTRYKAYKEDYDPEDYFTVSDIAEMLHMTKQGAYRLVCNENKKLRSKVSTSKVLVDKKTFKEWYFYQLRFQSDDPRLPKHWYEETYDIGEIRKMLGVKSRNTIYHLYKKKYFDVRKIGDELRIDKESFDLWFATQTQYPIKREEGGVQ